MIYSAKQFAEDTGVSVRLAKKILDMLDEQNLDPTELNSILWRIRDFVMKKDMPAMLEKVKDEEIKGIIDQMIVERAIYQAQCPRDVCCARTSEELEAAFNAIKMPESAWFFSTIEDKGKREYAEGDTVTIQIFRTGEWEHQSYGKVTIDKKVIKDVVKNFKDRKRGIEIAVDENHEENHRALGWIKDVYSEDGDTKCYAKIELTKKGAELLTEGAYKYFSPEIVFHKMDEESGEPMQNLLIGGAFTNRPFFKGMQPLMATEGATTEGQTSGNPASTGYAYFFSHSSMHKLLLLMDKVLRQKTFTSAEKAELETRYNELPKEDRNEDLNKKFAELLAEFDEGDDAEAEAKAKAEAEAAAAAAAAGDGGDGAAAPEGEKPEGTDGEVTANEDGTFTVDATFMESVKGIQKQLSKVSLEANLRACETKVRELCFTDAKPTNVVLPKHITKISHFAASLSEQQRKVFFEIIGSLKAIPAGEKGHGKERPAMDFSDPKSIPADDEAVQYFMEKLSQSLEEAQKSAANYYAGKAAK